MVVRGDEDAVEKVEREELGEVFVEQVARVGEDVDAVAAVFDALAEFLCAIKRRHADAPVVGAVFECCVILLGDAAFDQIEAVLVLDVAAVAHLPFGAVEKLAVDDLFLFT